MNTITIPGYFAMFNKHQRGTSINIHHMNGDPDNLGYMFIRDTHNLAAFKIDPACKKAKLEKFRIKATNMYLTFTIGVVPADETAIDHIGTVLLDKTPPEIISYDDEGFFVLQPTGVFASKAKASVRERWRNEANNRGKKSDKDKKSRSWERTQWEIVGDDCHITCYNIRKDEEVLSNLPSGISLWYDHPSIAWQPYGYFHDHDIDPLLAIQATDLALAARKCGFCDTAQSEVIGTLDHVLRKDNYRIAPYPYDEDDF